MVRTLQIERDADRKIAKTIPMGPRMIQPNFPSRKIAKTIRMGPRMTQPNFPSTKVGKGRGVDGTYVTD